MKTLGEFYKEKILSLPEKALEKREIHYSFLQNMKIARELFGWKIYYKKLGRKSHDFLECRSEEEARYLMAFISAGMTEICIPKDDEYLKSILPELERIKTRIDGILNSYLESISDRKVREQLKHEVFMEVTK